VELVDRRKIQQNLQRAQRLQGIYSAVHTSEVAARIGINAIDLECLDILQILGPLPAGQLAATAGLRTATITSILDRLEKAGLVRRDRTSEDRRVVLIHVEHRALEKIGPHFQHMVMHMAAVDAQFSEEELEIVHRYTTLAASAVAEAVKELRTNSGD
jgi:DNA-binding MarR family transcriptional regulator